jgi:hypothetical protein
MNSLLLSKLVQLAKMWAVQILDSELENKRAILQALGGRQSTLRDRWTHKQAAGPTTCKAARQQATDGARKQATGRICGTKAFCK